MFKMSFFLFVLALLFDLKCQKGDIIKVIIFEKKREIPQEVLRPQSIWKSCKLGVDCRVLTLSFNARLKTLRSEDPKVPK